MNGSAKVAPFRPRNDGAPPTRSHARRTDVLDGLIGLALCAAATVAHLWASDLTSGYPALAGYTLAVAAGFALRGRTAGLVAFYASIVPIGLLFSRAPPLGRLLAEAAAYVVACAAMSAIRGRGPDPASARVARSLSRRKLRRGGWRRFLLALPDGLAFYKAVRGPDDSISHFRLLGVAGALGGMLRPPPEGETTPLSMLAPSQPAGLAAARAVLDSGSEDHQRITLGGRRLVVTLRRAGPDDLLQILCDRVGEAQAEQERLADAQEMHHRVKNSLANVAALLRLQARTAGPEVREGLIEGADRVIAVAALHESLYRSGARDLVALDAYVADLCHRLDYSLLAGRRVRLHVHAQPVTTSISQAGPLGMIINELVTNAVKHAYPAGAGGAIVVVVRPYGGELQVTVADGGGGLPSDAQPAGGLGMVLVRSLTTQIGGRLTVTHLHPGLAFTVHAPLSDYPAVAQQSMF